MGINFFPKNLSLNNIIKKKNEIIQLTPTWVSATANKGSVGKEPACNTGDTGSIPGSGRPPAGGHSNPLQYPCLENPVDRGAWRATVHESQSRTRMKRLSPCTHTNEQPFLPFSLSSHSSYTAGGDKGLRAGRDLGPHFIKDLVKPTQGWLHHSHSGYSSPTLFIVIESPKWPLSSNPPRLSSFHKDLCLLSLNKEKRRVWGKDMAEQFRLTWVWEGPTPPVGSGWSPSTTAPRDHTRVFEADSPVRAREKGNYSIPCDQMGSHF